MRYLVFLSISVSTSLRLTSHTRDEDKCELLNWKFCIIGPWGCDAIYATKGKVRSFVGRKGFGRKHMSFHRPFDVGGFWMIANECLNGKNLLIMAWYNARFGMLLPPIFAPSAILLAFFSPSSRRYSTILIRFRTSAYLNVAGILGNLWRIG